MLEETGKFPSLIALRFLISLKKAIFWGVLRVVQWLRLRASTAGGKGSIPGWETKISCGALCSQKNKIKILKIKKEKKVNFWMYGEVMGNNSRCPVKETKKRCELE